MSDMADILRSTRPETAGGLARRLGLALLQHGVLGGPPPTVGRYQVLDKIGQGGMGVVFRAHDPALGRDVALKVLYAPGDALKDRLGREARQLAAVAHPNVLVIHDVGADDDDVWIAMEFLETGDLRSWVRARAPLDFGTLVDRFAEVAAGLHAAHEAGIVHRDVKPDNILVGPDDRARVADFGLARSEGTVPSDGAGPTTLEGTLRYLAPEVLAGGPTTAASDQYALFVGFEELTLCCDAVPAVARDWIAQGKAPRPEARFASLGEVATTLDRWRRRRLVRAVRRRVEVPTSSTRRRRLRDLVDLATSAPNREAFLAEALTWVDRAVGFDTALLGRTTDPTPGAHRIENFDPAFLAQFQAQAHRYAPVLARLAMHSADAGAPVRDVDVYDAAARAKNPFHAELIGPKGSKVMTVTTLRAAGRIVGSLQISRASRGTVFHDTELDLLSEAMPVLALGLAARDDAPGGEPEVVPTADVVDTAGGLDPFSRRILGFVAAGFTDADVSAATGVPVEAVGALVAQLTERLRAPTRTALGAFARHLGLGPTRTDR